MTSKYMCFRVEKTMNKLKVVYLLPMSLKSKMIANCDQTFRRHKGNLWPINNHAMTF